MSNSEAAKPLQRVKVRIDAPQVLRPEALAIIGASALERGIREGWILGLESGGYMLTKEIEVDDVLDAGPCYRITCTA